MVLKTLDSPLDCKEIKSVNPKGYQFCIFIGSADTDAEAPIIWPPDAKKWLIWKDRDAGKGWKQEEETTEDGMVGWHHWLGGHEFEQALGISDGQGGLECCSPWSHKESDMTEWLNWRRNIKMRFMVIPGLQIWMRWDWIYFPILFFSIPSLRFS